MSFNNDKSGMNINNYINIQQTAYNFIDYYYNTINSNFSDLISHDVIKTFTKIKAEGVEYTGDNLFNILAVMSQNHFDITKIEQLDSGSRRIDILVNGIINQTNHFSQTFLICHNDERWFLKNSIINII